MDDKAKTTEQLLEERTQDLVYAKLKLQEQRRKSNRTFAFSVIISIILLGCLVCFALSIFFITKEQTRQIQAIFSSDFVVTKESEITRQNADSGSTAILNNSGKFMNNTISANHTR